MLAATLALALAVPAPVSLPPQTIADWEGLRESDPRAAEIYLFATGEAYGWANVKLESRGDKPLFCTPRQLHLLSTNYIQMAEQEIAQRRAAHHLPSGYTVELALLEGLQRAFPCR